MKTGLTAIIPFRNEGEEVFHTITSIQQNAYNPINIIIINDGSDDGFNYNRLKTMNNVRYIENRVSIGPALSREYGIALCTTDYFILLDAHMRAKTKEWDLKILQVLKKYKRSVFCCMTSDHNGNDLFSHHQGMGVILNILDLSYTWNRIDKNPEEDITIIPCIMGASYCSNKNYWKKIHGLKELRSYGFEEQLISIKTYLEGGTCYVIKNVIFSHKFRDVESVPFSINNVDYIYNQLIIAELFYPLRYKPILFRQIKQKSDESYFFDAIKIIKDNRMHISNLKKYYKRISLCNFENLINTISIFTNLKL